MASRASRARAWRWSTRLFAVVLAVTAWLGVSTMASSTVGAQEAPPEECLPVDGCTVEPCDPAADPEGCVPPECDPVNDPASCLPPECDPQDDPAGCPPEECDPATDPTGCVFGCDPEVDGSCSDPCLVDTLSEGCQPPCDPAQPDCPGELPPGTTEHPVTSELAPGCTFEYGEDGIGRCTTPQGHFCVWTPFEEHGDLGSEACVLAETITPGPAPVVAPTAAPTLPRTGVDPRTLALVGLALAGTGSALRRGSTLAVARARVDRQS